MTNVMQMFPKMTLDDAKSQIIENLKEIHHSKPVNFFCAVTGIKNLDLQDEALQVLITEGVVRKQIFKHRDRFGNGTSLPLYKINLFPQH